MSDKIEVIQIFYSVSQVADALGVCERTIVNWLKGGVLTGHRMGGLWRIGQNDLDEFLNRTRQAAGRSGGGIRPAGGAAVPQ